MSRTIITNSKIDFFTNINSEQSLGELCHIAKAKTLLIRGYNVFPYKMSKEECDDTSVKLLNLIPDAEDLFKKFKHYFEKGSTSKDLIDFIAEYAKIIRASKDSKLFKLNSKNCQTA